MDTNIKQTKVAINCGSLFLEGVLYEPESESRLPGVVVCHPAPLHGGNMDNIIVMRTVSALAKRGIVALRFNFRGVGESQGKMTWGIDEPEDVRAALSFLEEQPSVLPHKLGLVGYSFGASIGLMVAATDQRPKALVAISLPFLHGSGSGDPITDVTARPGIQACTTPRLFIIGERDQFAPLPLFHEKVGRLSPPFRIEVIPGADHFWFGHAAEAAAKAADFLEETLLAPIA